MGLLGKGQPAVPKLFQNHSLSKLIPPVRAISKAMCWDFSCGGPGLSSFAEFEQFVATLDSVDAGSYAFRYPVNAAGQANLPHHLTINVPRFRTIMEPLLALLEGAVAQIEDHWDVATQAAYEIQQYLAETNEG